MCTSEDWAKLCDEYAIADKEFIDAWHVITKKFSAIAQGKSKENPTQAEIERHDNAYDNRQRIHKVMNKIIRDEFGG